MPLSPDPISQFQGREAESSRSQARLRRILMSKRLDMRWLVGSLALALLLLFLIPGEVAGGR